MTGRELLPTALVLATLLGCSAEETPDTVDAVSTDAAARPSVVMALPLRTESDAARQHFMRGQRNLDQGRPSQARGHFEAAIAEDPGMALAHLRAAQTASSFDQYRTHLRHAEADLDQASEVERLLIEIERHGFDGNREARLAAAEALVELAPESPRAWLVLAQVQHGLNDVAGARTSIARAIEVSPDFANAHLAMANSLILRAPRDPAAAGEHARRAVELEPGEALPHDIQGDVYRAAGDFEGARNAYTRAAELDPSGSGHQQLGHVYSFLGAYDEARASYDEAISRAEGNARATYGTWRAFVHLYEDDPQGAIDELNDLVDRIDAMGIPEPVGVKISALGQIGLIAVHTGLLAQAENAHARRAELVQQQIAEVDDEAFRRGAEADLLVRTGMVLAASGDADGARARAREMMALLEPDSDPRKNESAHDLMGMASFHEGDWEAALAHLEQGDRNNVYNQYLRARALEASGRADEARRLYRGIVDNRFNNVFVALVRNEALTKAG